MPFVPFLHRVIARENLSAEDAMAAMLSILEGEATAAQIAGFLVALRMKGETSDELLGFATAMREKAIPVDVGLPGELLLDTCGTGGDGGRTFNISTVAAFAVAGAGVRVAKHGNRSLSSQCGSADLLEELGVKVQMSPDRVAAAIREVGIGFLFAPLIHPAMKYAQPARADLKMRTAFNLLGPLTNPAGAKRQLIGAPSIEAAELMANALRRLPVERALVVHGLDGMDEVTTCESTIAFELNSGIQKRLLQPEDFGIQRSTPADLVGGDRKRNAEIAVDILEGRDLGAKRDIVVVNAAAALWIAGVGGTLSEAAEVARKSIESGAAARKLHNLQNFNASE